MTPMIKAPDLGVVKSLAKALRKTLPESVTLSHAKALEASANAFGFSNWHACRAHFARLNAGAFDPPALRDESKDIGAVLIRQELDPIERTLDLLSGELRTFRSDSVDVTGGISCGRSIKRFLAPLIELGARHDEDLFRSGSGHPIGEADARRLSCHVNTLVPVPADLPHIAGSDTLLIGCADVTRIFQVNDFRIPKVLKRGLLKVEGEKPKRVVRLDFLQKYLRETSVYPHPEATFAVSSAFLTEVMRGCQARINDATTPEPDWAD